MPVLSELKGFREANEALSRVGIALNGPQATEVMLRGAKIIQRGVIAHAPLGKTSKNPGSLKRAVYVNVLPPGKSGYPAGAIVMVNYSPRRGPIAPHAHLVEEGTKPHKISAPGKSGNAKVLLLKVPGGGVFRKVVQHPGVPGRFFFADAVSLNKPAARQAIREGMAELAEQAAKV